MKRVLGIFVVLALLVPVFAFAGGTGEGGGAKTYTFAYMPGILDPFMQMIEKGARAKAKELGINLVVGEYPKAWGPDQEVPILNALVAKGNINFLLVVPTSTQALIAPLKQISDKGIPMVTTDTYLGDGDYNKASNYSFPLAYIGTDNEGGGYEVGKKLADMIGGSGKVYINSTNPDVSSVNGRRDGALRAFKEYPNIQVVGVDYNLDNQDKAQAQTAAVLQANPDLKGVFGTNLFSAQGVYRAVQNAGLTGAVKIASWDAGMDQINALKAGQIDFTLAQKPFEIGQLAVQAGYDYLTKKAMVPNKVLRPGYVIFTKDNVDDPDMQQWIYKP